ncbi:MFS-type transporter SLC18B1-like [Sinocyclocheilus anshuiensis]|uniref:MFS-type transporter SLC18B1-like n=1 Tax=Sinocyclocheilus anshuiensis TaxID=1608454 RepID=UPI0007BAC93B|nr:PREDICTED: MFS-type transporter SLC18B1-like [Sinocyclocheilus anshuiensis]
MEDAKKKGVSQAMIGLIFGIYALCTLVGSLLLGKYIVQIGAKFMIVAGLFVSSGCTVLFGFLDQVSDGTVFVVLCFITRCINAIGFSAAVTSSFAVSAKVFPESIATVLGFMEIFTGLGLILGPPLGGWLYQSFGYEIPFVFTGCLLFATVPLNLWILPSFDAVPSSQNSFLRLCTRMKILLICFVVFSLSSGLGFLDATLSIFAIEKISEVVTSWMMGVSLTASDPGIYERGLLECDKSDPEPPALSVGPKKKREDDEERDRNTVMFVYLRGSFSPSFDLSCTTVINISSGIMEEQLGEILYDLNIFFERFTQAQSHSKEV